MKNHYHLKLACVFLFVLSGLMTSTVLLAETPVTVVSPEKSKVSDNLSLSGTLTAEKQAMLSPRVDGLVSKVFVDAGSKVKKGDLLLELDPALSKQVLAQAKAATAEAQAARNEAQRLVDEAKGLREKNYISASENASRLSNLNLSEAALMAAKAAEASAQEQLSRHRLPAPFSGVISAKLTEVGEWVNRGTTVLELVATNKVRLDVKVPQERFSEINRHSQVEVIPDVFPDERFKGTINAIVPVSDPQARAFLVRILIDTGDISLLPGTSAKAIIGLNDNQQKQQRIIIPRDALLLHPDGGYSVFVVKDGVAKRHKVHIGTQSSQGVTILSGITLDDKVVTRGNEVLRDGQSITIVESAQ
ncbi:efflux RND transporter periplasmic adaptor subunit [Methylophaga thalassica]|uniref:efflux RND transporter periplasmic adaptor subunit n=1 Tax=Methylophaga aminisulfidivorans TaxID=230105 RepID=UPI0024E20454|nr:efflux RND transporter periplasmic adaptor subunit [Methylophaga aminisulfidivorans]